MTAGTKIFLAFVGLFVLVLVIYYGFLLPDDRPRVVYDEVDARADQVEPREHDDEIRPRPRPPQRRSSQPSDQPVVREQPADPIDQLHRPSVPSASPRDTQASRDLKEPHDQAEPDRPADRDDRHDAEHAQDKSAETDERSDEVRPLPDAPLFDLRPDQVDDSGDDQMDSQGEEANGEGGDIHEQRSAELQEDEELDERASEVAQEAHESDPAAPAPALPERPEYTKYTVEAGDTLSTIAEEWFGTADKWDLIARANPRVDPLRLRIGQELRLPPKDTERDDPDAEAPDHETVYTVRSGDNLSRIAQMYYNDSSLWRLIFDANRETMRNNPDRLRVGMELRIPPAPAPAEGASR